MRSRSTTAQNMPGSGIREIIELASAIPDAIHLEACSPSFSTPDHITDGALRAARDGATGYTSTFGSRALRRAIADRYERRWASGMVPENVLVAHGAVNAIAATCFAILEPGDEVLVPDPGWPNYVSVVSLIGAIPVPYHLSGDNGFRPEVDAVSTLITDKTKMLLLCNPSNPTGVVWDAATVEAMVDLARERDLFVLSDEIYEDLTFDGAHVPARRFDDSERLVTVSGVSKSYAMTGWRVGWAIGSRSLVQLAGKVQEPLITCASAISQAAAVLALEGPQDDVDRMRDSYRRRRDLAVAILEPAGLLPSRPQGAFYAMVDLSGTGQFSRESALALLEEQRVACVPGNAFGRSAEGFVRISFAASADDVVEGCRRIVEFSR